MKEVNFSSKAVRDPELSGSCTGKIDFNQELGQEGERDLGAELRSILKAAWTSGRVYPELAGRRWTEGC